MRSRVEFTDGVRKTFRCLPLYVVNKLRTWAVDVELIGLENVRQRPGFHDEPLRGGRAGQRSIRLSRAYRAIYVELSGAIRIVRVIEVSRHEY